MKQGILIISVFFLPLHSFGIFSYRTIVKYILISCLIGCSFKNNVTHTLNEPLKGTFLSYHSAMGAGKGIILRVTIPLPIANTLRIDSFYVKGNAYPFRIIKSRKETYLEINYYAANPQPSYGSNEIPKPDPKTKEITDSILVGHRFYPSWIIGTGKSGKQWFNILSYKEIIPESNY